MIKNFINKILNYRLFYSKFGEKNKNLNFAHKTPVVLGKTIKSNWAYDNTEQINIFHYWLILWFMEFQHIITVKEHKSFKNHIYQIYLIGLVNE